MYVQICILVLETNENVASFFNDGKNFEYVYLNY